MSYDESQMAGEFGGMLLVQKPEGQTVPLDFAGSLPIYELTWSGGNGPWKYYRIDETFYHIKKDRSCGEIIGYLDQIEIDSLKLIS